LKKWLFSDLSVLLHRRQADHGASLGQTSPFPMVHPLCPPPASLCHCLEADSSSKRQHSPRFSPSCACCASNGEMLGMEAGRNTGLVERGTSQAPKGLRWSKDGELSPSSKQALLWRRQYLILQLFVRSSLLTREERVFFINLRPNYCSPGLIKHSFQKYWLAGG